MSDPGHGSSIPPDPRQRVGYQYPPVAPPGQFGPPPGQGQTAPKQPLSARLASTLDSWQKVVLACTALIVAIGGLGAAIEATHFKPSGSGAPQASSTAGFSGIQIPGPTQATGLPAGCQQGQEAITTFRQTAGSTPSSMQNAAQRAAIETDNAGSGASGVVALDLQHLGDEFLNLYTAAVTASDFSSQGQYSTELDQINADSQQLAKDCNTA